MASNLTTLKVAFGEDIRRIAVPNTISWNELRHTLGCLFGIDGSEIVLVYRDAEGDNITVASDLELRQIISEGALVRLTVSLRPQVRSAAPTPTPAAAAAPVPEASKPQASASPSPQKQPADASASTSAPKEEQPQAPPTLSSVMEGLHGLFEEAQRVWQANPQLEQQGEQLFKQFAEVAQAQAAQHGDAFGAFPGCFPFGAGVPPCHPFSNARAQPEGAAPAYPFFQAPAQPEGAAPTAFPFFNGPAWQEDEGEAAKLAQLASMGFYDTEVNRALLRKHLGNVHRVVAELLS